MSNYNSQLQSNNTDLQTVLQTLQTKAAGGEQATPVISVNASGLITATAGTKSSTHQLAFQPAKTITPSAASQIAVSSGYYTGGNITVAGDVNLVAGNIKSGVSIFGVSGTLVEGSGGGSGEQVEWSENEDSIISRTISSYFNDRVTNIGVAAFYGFDTLISVNFPNCININGKNFVGAGGRIGAFARCYNLKTVSFPACKSIGAYAFSDCSSLTTVSFPACTSIGSEAFVGCSSLTTVIFPVCTNIGDNVFSDCYNLTTVSFPVCTSIGSGVFGRCSQLSTVNFPTCTNISNNAFYYCRNLTSVSFPKCTNISNSAFCCCYNLTSISFPACTNIGNYAFYGCSQLRTVNFPVCTSIGNDAFYKCLNLSQFYLNASSVCALAGSEAFTATPYTGYSTSFSGTPYIYVPSSLVDAYKTATNWTYFSSYFSNIESLGGGDAGGDNTDLIKFYLNDMLTNRLYQVPSGMTWREYIAYDTSSDFALTNGISSNGVYWQVINKIYLDSMMKTAVDPDDYIIDGYTYYM